MLPGKSRVRNPPVPLKSISDDVLVYKLQRVKICEKKLVIEVGTHTCVQAVERDASTKALRNLQIATSTSPSVGNAERM